MSGIRENTEELPSGEPTGAADGPFMAVSGPILAACHLERFCKFWVDTLPERAHA